MNILFKVDDNIIFFKPNIDIKSIGENLMNGISVGYNIDGLQMSITYAYAQLFQYGNRDLSNPIKANMDLSSTILSIVRNDLINLSMTDAIATLSTMQSIIFMVQMGLFATAAALLDSTTRTDILTDELLNKYSTMLRSADAII